MSKLNSLKTSNNKLVFWSERIKNIEESPKPILLVASLTGRCNWNCDFCYLRDQKTEDLDYDKLINFIDSLPIVGIELTGGEPTLYKKINELIEHCHKKGIKLGMTTNGSMITDQMRVSGKCPITEDNIEKFEWIRISINKYHKERITPTWSINKPYLGFNLIFHKGLEAGLSLMFLKKFIKENECARYLRIALDRNSDEITEEAYNNYLKHYQGKVDKIHFRPKTPNEFYMGWKSL